MNHALLIEEVGGYVNSYMKKHKSKELVFHSLDHTKAVVSAATQIATHYQLTEDDFFCVIVAAWLHDFGYCGGANVENEIESASFAAGYLVKKQVPDAIIEKVRRCILATQMPQQPADLLEEIVCDADLFHFGSDDFFEWNKRMRKELALLSGKQISGETWRLNTIGLLEEHAYHTDYCQQLLDDKKQAHLDVLRERQMNKSALHENGVQVPSLVVPDKKDKPSVPGRGVETMFRITSGNNQRLSDMADNKAHILITVNSIILSAIISLVLRKLDENSFLTYPTFSLLLVSVVTIVISILATRPAIPNGVFTADDIKEKKVNLLFFGNFYRMDLAEYAEGMRKIMTDSEFLYGTLIKDVYAQGVVLGHKYRLLRLSYTVFMFGLVLSVLGYLFVFLLYK